MTQEQYNQLIKEFGRDNTAIKQMMLLVENCGKKLKELDYKGIKNAAALYVRKS